MDSKSLNSFLRNDTESEIQMGSCMPLFRFWLLTDKNTEQSAVAAEDKIEMTSETSFFLVTMDAKQFPVQLQRRKAENNADKNHETTGGLSCP